MQTNQEKAFTKENKAKAEDLFEELVEVIKDTFVATYKRQGTTLKMRIPNGQTFNISVEEA